ncbi:MAG: hypothetical protein N2749_06980 [Clostridia bacterium]|nr:hypothetical protein [Clostridia bacterium]
MEDNAYEALMIGTFVLVFIAALSTTIYLMSSMSNYAELAFEYGKKVPENTINTAMLNDTAQIIVNGSQLISYYYNYKNLDDYGDTKPVKQYIIKVGSTDIPENLDYRTLLNYIDVKKDYVLKVEGYNSDGTVNIRIS